MTPMLKTKNDLAELLKRNARRYHTATNEQEQGHIIKRVRAACLEYQERKAHDATP